MNFYQFHIGDYIKATAHLDPIEDICYRRLLDLYYDSERCIGSDVELVSRKIRIETQVVLRVLKEFFAETEIGWVNWRAEDEIKRYHQICARNQTNGKLGGRPKKTQSVSFGNPDETQMKPNHEPLTMNHEEERTLLSGEKPPDVLTLNGYRREATEVLGFLNEKTGRRYEAVKSNLSLIAARLKEGATVIECRQVIAKKVREWGADERMAQYLRPATLFNATKFAQYKGELGV